jgi:hypothetical protein
MEELGAKVQHLMACIEFGTLWGCMAGMGVVMVQGWTETVVMVALVELPSRGVAKTGVGAVPDMSILAAIYTTEHVPQRIYKADGDAHSWEWLAMVSPCVDVLCNLANHINTDLGAHQGKKHTSPDMKKNIDILMASLSKLEVHVKKEGRTLNPDEMPVPDAVSVSLAELAHGLALANYNSQFKCNHERRRLVPISTLLQHLDNYSLSPIQPLHTTSACPPDHPPNSLNATHASHPTPPPLVNDDTHHVKFPDTASDLSDSDESDFENDKPTTAEWKPTSFLLENKTDVAIDVDTVIDLFEDDEYPWEEVFGQYNNNGLDIGTDRDIAEWDSD